MAIPDENYSDQGKPMTHDDKYEGLSKSVWKSEEGSGNKRGFQNPGVHSRKTGKRQ